LYGDPLTNPFLFLLKSDLLRYNLYTLKFTILKYTVFSWVLVAHAYNPSYSGGRDQEKLAWTNSSWDPISKKTHHKKRVGSVAQGESLEFKPQHCKKIKNKEYSLMSYDKCIKLCDNLHLQSRCRTFPLLSQIPLCLYIRCTY
jgi:hypothetical protein